MSLYGNTLPIYDKIDETVPIGTRKLPDGTQFYYDISALSGVEQSENRYEGTCFLENQSNRNHCGYQLYLTNKQHISYCRTDEITSTDVQICEFYIDFFEKMKKELSDEKPLTDFTNEEIQMYRTMKPELIQNSQLESDPPLLRRSDSASDYGFKPTLVEQDYVFNGNLIISTKKRDSFFDHGNPKLIPEIYKYYVKYASWMSTKFKNYDQTLKYNKEYNKPIDISYFKSFITFTEDEQKLYNLILKLKHYPDNTMEMLYDPSTLDLSV